MSTGPQFIMSRGDGASKSADGSHQLIHIYVLIQGFKPVLMF